MSDIKIGDAVQALEQFIRSEEKRVLGKAPRVYYPFWLYDMCYEIAQSKNDLELDIRGGKLCWRGVEVIKVPKYDWEKDCVRMDGEVNE